MIQLPRVEWRLVFSLSLSLSLSLFQTNLHMRVAMQAPPNKQNCARSTLPTAEEAQRLWIPALTSMCLLVQSAALAPAGSAIFRQHAGRTVRLPPPLSPSPAVTWRPHRPVFHPSNCSHPGFDALSLQRSAWEHRTLTSIQSCCRTPGNQETTSKMAHRITGAASLMFLTQS